MLSRATPHSRRILSGAFGPCHLVVSSSASRALCTGKGSDPTWKEHIVVGGGPVGTSAAWFLAEREHEVMLLHDPKMAGAHEDWSRLARLSVDGPKDEYDCSLHAVELLELVEEVRQMNSGAPVLPVTPGMLFVASPGTNMALALERGESYGDSELIRRDPAELDELYPGNSFTLPEGTLCWSHPTGLWVSPIELCDANLQTCKAYGVEEVHGRATIDVGPDDEFIIRNNDGQVFATRNLHLMAGAWNKALCEDSPSELLRDIPEFDSMYITAISTVRYRHRNQVAIPDGKGHTMCPIPTGKEQVCPPIILGQLELPGVCDFQANFSVVAEEYGDVYKTRLSGAAGSEVIERVEDMHHQDMDDVSMADIYGRVFGSCFPFLETEKALDFNRCVTYRNHIPAFSGTSLLAKHIGEGEKKSTMLTTAGCFGVGVKFGPVLGELAADYVDGNEPHIGMNVIESGIAHELDGDNIERAW